MPCLTRTITCEPYALTSVTDRGGSLSQDRDPPLFMSGCGKRVANTLNLLLRLAHTSKAIGCAPSLCHAEYLNDLITGPKTRCPAAQNLNVIPPYLLFDPHQKSFFKCRAGLTKGPHVTSSAFGMSLGYSHPPGYGVLKIRLRKRPKALARADPETDGRKNTGM